MALGHTASHDPVPAPTATALSEATATQSASPTSNEPWAIQPPLILAFVAIGILIIGGGVLYWTRRIRGLAYDGSTIRAHARAVFGDALDGSGLSNSTPLGKRPKLWEVQLGVSQQTRGWEIVRPISARYVINGDDPIFGVEEFGQLPYPVTSRTAATPWSTMCRLLPSLRRPPCPDNTSNCSRPLPTTINRDIQLLVPILMPTPPTLPSEYVSDSTQQLPPPVFCLGLANLNYPHPTRDAHFEEDGDDEEGKASPTHQVSELPVPWLPPHRALSRSLLPSRSFS